MRYQRTWSGVVAYMKFPTSEESVSTRLVLLSILNENIWSGTRLPLFVAVYCPREKGSTVCTDHCRECIQYAFLYGWYRVIYLICV